MRYSLALACAMMATPIAAQDVRVITDFPVTHSLVAMVTGNAVAADLLLDRGGDPHSFQLRPSQARALSEADLIFWMGAELTPWLARALSGVEARGEVVTLLQAEGVSLQEFGKGHDDHGHSDDHGHDHDDHAHSDDHGDDHDDHGHSDDHGHDHGHSDEHAHDHDDHAKSGDHGHDHDDHGHDNGHSDDHGHDHDDHGHSDDHDHSHDGFDPHAWLNTANARIWLDVIATELAEHDPQNAETYAANAAAAKETIANLSNEIEAILEPVGDAALVTFHDAYGYFAAQFGLNIVGTIALGDAAAPGAQRLSDLRAELQQEGAVCIFPEVNHSSRHVDTVVEGTGVRVGAELDPAGVTLEPGADLYPDLLRSLAQSIADCVAG